MMLQERKSPEAIANMWVSVTPKGWEEATDYAALEDYNIRSPVSNDLATDDIILNLFSTIDVYIVLISVSNSALARGFCSILWWRIWSLNSGFLMRLSSKTQSSESCRISSQSWAVFCHPSHPGQCYHWAYIIHTNTLQIYGYVKGNDVFSNNFAMSFNFQDKFPVIVILRK